MKHRAFTIVEMIVVLIIIAILAAILLPVLAPRPHHGSPRSGCISNQKQIGLGFLQYANDYDERFPAVAASGGWGNAVQPYLKSWRIYHCPSANSQRDEQTTDYYMNARLSSVKLEKIEAVSLSILMGEGKAGQNLDYSQMQLPDAWRTDEKSPAWRHLETANYLFVDGHVKSLKPEQVTMQPPAAGAPTFLIR